MRDKSMYTSADRDMAEKYLSRLGRLADKIEARAEHMTVLQALNAAAEWASPEEKQLVENRIRTETELMRADVAEMIQVDAEIRETISLVEDPQLKTLLELRYMGCLTWEAVAERMDYERRQIFRKRTAALDEVAKILKHVTECHCRVEL